MPVYSSAIDWPNGEGYTPCTDEYRSLMDQRDAIFDPNFDSGSTEDLSSEDYEKWHSLDARLCELQMAGALGKSVRF